MKGTESQAWFLLEMSWRTLILRRNLSASSVYDLQQFSASDLAPDQMNKNLHFRRNIERHQGEGSCLELGVSLVFDSSKGDYQWITPILCPQCSDNRKVARASLVFSEMRALGLSRQPHPLLLSVLFCEVPER
jgi:hypothetical protein